MDFTDIIDDIQQSILVLQHRLDELRTMDDQLVQTVLLSRQEAAEFIGESVRQFDRDCQRFGIRKINTINGVRVRKADLMLHMGLMREDINSVVKNTPVRRGDEKLSDFERILSARR